MVDRTIFDVLNKGWFFNIDYDMTLVPDSGGFITLPPSVLRMDSQSKQYILRNGKVYDTYSHSFIITQPIEVDLIYYVEIEELPVSAYFYIGARAARKFQEKVIGDIDMTKITLQEEVDALSDLQREDLQYSKYTLIRGSRIHNGYLVAGLYKSIGRR